MDRLKEEGKYPEWKVWYDKYKGMGESVKAATMAACKEMGYKGADYERLRAKDEVFEKEYEERRHRESIEIQREQIDVFKQLADFDVDSSELPDDVAFVFHNLHKCKGEQEEWLISPEEAPSPGAWAMLTWAVGNTSKFMEQVIREQLKINSQKEVDTSMRAVDVQIEQIEEMLRGIKKEVSNGEKVIL
tara:strand:- start:176 stop:742 length:567 start_codon:yes stop_codon:yes gene_type:complete